jgi:N-acetylglutamate synthase/N-acetylornithine aminotransferase
MKVAVKAYSDYLAGYGKIAAVAQKVANRIYKDQEGFTKVINMKESIVDKEFEKFFG